MRHYTYGGDLARGIVTAMEHPPRSTTTSTCRPPESTTVLELAERIWQRHQGRRAVPLQSATTRSSTTCSARPAIDKARDVLGFEATTSLDDMLDDVVPWILEAMEQGLI